MAYPTFEQYQADREQEQLKQQIMLMIDSNDGNTEVGHQSKPQVPRKGLPTTSKVNAGDSRIPYDLDGILRIAKIDLEVPLIRGTSVEKLNVAPTTITDQLRPGSLGNYAIAGHRSRKFGRHFNRLDELVIGDLVEVQTPNKVWLYKIDKKTIVKPTDLSVLEPMTNGREITLITCHPFGSNKYRLVLHGTELNSD